MSLFSRFRRTDVAPNPASDLPKVVGPVDAVLAACVVALVTFGVVIVYSASAVHAEVRLHDAAFFLKRQTVYSVLGLTVMFVLAGIDYHRLKALTYPIFAVAGVLLVAVAFGAGRTALGATRWIELGPVNVQPAEVAKVAVIFWLSYSLAKKRDKLTDFSVGFLPHVLFAGIYMMLCLFQPDFGSALMIGTITFVLLFTAGTRLGYLLGSVVASVPVVVLLVITSEYRMRRVTGFLGIGEDVANATYQVDQSSYAFAQGGAFGRGLGDSVQKLLFLPEAHTDFISAIVGEELGFLGTLALVVAFVVVVGCAMRAAIHAVDDYGTYLATGIGTFVGLQAFTNLGVAMGLLPTKGLALPFISYGGSSLLVNCAAIGVLLNVSRPREAPVVETPPDAGAKANGGGRGARPHRNVAIAGGAA